MNDSLSQLVLSFTLASCLTVIQTNSTTGECDDQEESQGLLAQFIDYIQQRKTVPLEQLATEFKLRTTEVIDRVQGLENMGRLTGVMDERGKVSGPMMD